MSLTLAIDTSSVVSVGLARGTQRLASAVVDDQRAHAEQLMPLIEVVCDQVGVAVRDVHRVAVGLGPGPFTGLRVGIVTGRTLAHLAGGEAVGVCSLDVLAHQWAHGGEAPDEFVACIDARRKELYWARYDGAGARVGELRVTSPRELPDLPIIGPGVAVLGGDPRISSLDQLDVGFMAAHLDALPSAGVEPLYLRKPDATPPTTRKSALVVPRRRAAR